MLDSQTKADLGIKSNWLRFEEWKTQRNNRYRAENGRLFSEDVPDPKERKSVYESELKAQGIRA